MMTEKEKELRTKTYTRGMLLFIMQLSWLIGIVVSYSFVSLGLFHLRLWGFFITFGIVAFLIIGLIVLHQKINDNNSKIFLPFSHKSLKITAFFYSGKTQKEVFVPIVADWDEEYFEALSNKEIWKARWINMRYTYAFIIAIWQKSPIGDLIEFIRKIAK